MTTYDVQSFYDGLVKHGLIVPVRVQGAFGRGAVFEDVLERFNGLVTELSKDDGAEVYTFPPVIDRTIIEQTDYLDSFPQLAGTVFSFLGKEKQARELSERVHAGQPWGDSPGMTDVVPQPGGLLSGLPGHRRRAPREGAPDHDDELGLPARAVSRADADAVVPRARVRARGRPRRRRSPGATRGTRGALPCSSRSGSLRSPRSRPIRSSGARGRCSRRARRRSSSSSRSSSRSSRPRSPPRSARSTTTRTTSATSSGFVRRGGRRP